MNNTFTDDFLDSATAALRSVNAALYRAYPGESGHRQPVHTFYGGAHLFRAHTPKRLGELALQSLTDYGSNPIAFAKALGVPSGLADMVYSRVREKLRREPIEDFRIDFEDGYGNRPDAEEDGHAVSAAKELARAWKEHSLPPYIGIRVKPLTNELMHRSLRTLDLFLTTTLAETGGVLPENFVITLPKLTVPEQPQTFAAILTQFELAAHLPPQSLRFEFMVETTQAILDGHGHSNLPKFLAACEGRCAGAHLGVYDYTAATGISAAHQTMLHPACDFARSMMQVAFAGTGVPVSDGGTNIMPVPIHRGETLTPAQHSENLQRIYRAWKIHFDHVTHSLVNGFYQGWDLHPAQLPTRFAAVYAFYFQSLEAASARLKNFVEKAAQATLVGDVFDDAATGQGLLNFFLRATSCGAISSEEAEQRTGLTREEFLGASFVKILKNRTA